ncbi:iron-sulfur cluster assembly 1 homolog, mitochondrial-like [Rhopilema esculentum]|uniref:iron-sulfur cluster assembly 1 homolog, mitochondrial-like n=1 Tax=Rhopilema esculentum TaxID=499914 RepID=UPI0031DB9D42
MMASRIAATASIRAVSKAGRIRALRAPITLTQAAVSRVKGLLQENKEYAGMRIGVKERGCNGLSYTLEYSNEKKKFDEEVNQDGVKLFICSKAQLTLLGTEMDYVEDKLSSGFVFNNPNIKGTCGCGESFHV